ncbi:MAG: D-alanyl-D-alanine carboxypeptidase family protein, partial [Chloroflexi bacterium]|nr:D-alanyl-D-alanine carboxypeptidase family protein [Chloroflexota bacterium]
LAEHGWRYGFLVSYPPGAEARTGYVHEPWHLRWVGRPLAAAIHVDGYLAGGIWTPAQFTLQEYLDTAQLLLT